MTQIVRDPLADADREVRVHVGARRLKDGYRNRQHHGDVQPGQPI
jgi:hypothetical protein